MGRKVPLVVVLVAAVVVVAAALVGVTYSALSSTSSNPPSSLSAASGFCSRSSAVWLTGMEHGLVSTAGGGLFNTVTGAPTADTATVRNGVYSLRIADTAAGSTINALKTFTAASVVVARFAVRLSSLPGVNSNLAYVDSATGEVDWSRTRWTRTRWTRTRWTRTRWTTATGTLSPSWAGASYVCECEVVDPDTGEVDPARTRWTRTRWTRTRWTRTRWTAHWGS